MTKTVGLIGSGNIGGAVAQLAVNAGLDVVLSNSRGPETLADLVASLGPRARAATAAEAATAGDIVVASVPLKAYNELPVAELAGKTVIETLNYYPGRDGQIPDLLSGAVTSSTLVQRHLVGARVVKGFNNIYARHLLTLARPSGAADRSALPIAADDPEAKAEAVAFLDLLGWDAADAGTLADSWRQQPGTPVYGEPYIGPKPEGLSDEELWAWVGQTPGVPVPAATILEYLAAAEAITAAD